MITALIKGKSEPVSKMAPHSAAVAYCHDTVLQTQQLQTAHTYRHSLKNRDAHSS